MTGDMESFATCLTTHTIRRGPFRATSFIHEQWGDRVTIVIIFLTILFVSRYLRDRRFVKIRGCQSSYSNAPVKDPIIGLDFIYERFFRNAPERTLQNSHEIFQRLGSTYKVSRWTSQAIHTCDAENIRHMLATAFEDFRLPKVRVSVMTDLLGTGIFTLDGRSWAHARAVLRPTLAKQKMTRLPAVLERHCKRLLCRISQEGDRKGGEKVVNLQPLFFCFSMDVATEFLMGSSTNMLDSSKSTAKETQFVEDYMRCSEEATKKMCLGPLSHFRFNREAARAKERVFRYVDEYIGQSLQRQQEQGDADANHETTFMQELAATIADRKALRDQVLHILLASRDTTASLLSNLFFMLGRKPGVYAKLREEVVAAAGEGLPTFEQLKDMRYLKWCVNESLRLHPIIASNARQAARDTTLPHGGGRDRRSPLFVRKGTVVLYNVYAMHRDAGVFGPDAGEFVPERWAGLRPGWSYLPFNGGPRVCIGQHFALMEAYYVVARLVQTFAEVESRDGRPWMELSALATTCKNGVHVTLKKA